jgi:hypothetical protein
MRLIPATLALLALGAVAPAADWQSLFDGKGMLDDDAHRRHDVGRRGQFALQLHKDDELLIQFRDIRVRVLD